MELARGSCEVGNIGKILDFRVSNIMLCALEIKSPKFLLFDEPMSATDFNIYFFCK